jgi:aspartate aminotransferase
MSTDLRPYFNQLPADTLNQLSFSDTTMGMQASKILTISYSVRERIAAGAAVTQFTVGDFKPTQFQVPELLKSSIYNAVENDQSNYPPADGIIELRQAIRDHYQRDLGLDYPVESVITASGARALLYSTYQCLLNPGELVLAPAPGWNNHNFSQLVSAEVINIPSDPSTAFMPTAKALAPHISKARLLVICSPMNPTGTLIRKSQLQEICQLIVTENQRREVAGERLLYLVYDHVYRMLTFDDHQHYTPPEIMPEMARYTIFSDAISKCFAATGLRVGWLVAPPHITQKIKALMTHMGAWAARPIQSATADLLQQPDAIHNYITTFKQAIKTRLDLLYNAFSQWKIEGLPVDVIAPEGAMYLSVKFNLIGKEQFPNPEAIRLFLLTQADCAVIPFDCFGDQKNLGWFRFSVGGVAISEVEQCLVKIKTALQSLA